MPCMPINVFHRDLASCLREVIADPDVSDTTRERAAVMARRVADFLRADYRGFSYEWFFGACGLDHWGEVITT